MTGVRGESLRGAWVTGLCPFALNLYFSCSGEERGVGETERVRAFGILLTSEVRLRQIGEGAGSASEWPKRGALLRRGCLCSFSSTTFLKTQRPPWERPRRMNHPRFLPPPGPALRAPRI